MLVDTPHGEFRVLVANQTLIKLVDLTLILRDMFGIAWQDVIAGCELLPWVCVCVCVCSTLGSHLIEIERTPRVDEHVQAGCITFVPVFVNQFTPWGLHFGGSVLGRQCQVKSACLKG